MKCVDHESFTLWDKPNKMFWKHNLIPDIYLKDVVPDFLADILVILSLNE